MKALENTQAVSGGERIRCCLTVLRSECDEMTMKLSAVKVLYQQQKIGSVM